VRVATLAHGLRLTTYGFPRPQLLRVPRRSWGRGTQITGALWPEAAPDRLEPLLGRYRLDGSGAFDVVRAGNGLEVRGIGHEACARLLYGLPRHPEWPELFAELESRALLHLRPLLKRDAASFKRGFAPGIPEEAAATAVAQIEVLVARHGQPGKPEVLGSRTFGSNATWITVPFGSTPCVLRAVWHGYAWREVAIDVDDLPAAVGFVAEGDGFVGRSLDGKQELRLAFARGPGPARNLRLRDASKEGRAGVVARRAR